MAHHQERETDPTESWRGTKRGRFRHGFLRVSRDTAIALAVVVVLLIAARIALPYVLKAQINKRLARIPDYTGQVESVHVALWRGAYALRGIKIVKGTGAVPEPFFSARNIDFSLAWRELLHGHIVSDIVADGPQLNFVRAKSEQASQLEADRRWQDAIQDIFPIDITYLRLNDADIHFVDKSVEPEVDVYLTGVKAVATGLRNRTTKDPSGFPASITVEGNTIGHGIVSVSAQLEPLAEKPKFEIKATVDQVALPELNRFLLAYGKVDVSAGNLKLYAEMAAKDGRFEGYVKPFLNDVSFKDATGENKGVMHHVWETIVSGLVKVLKNKERDQLGARIPFAGEFGSTQVGFWATVRSMFHHGFIKALPESLEHSVKSDDIPPPGAPLKIPSQIPREPASQPVPLRGNE